MNAGGVLVNDEGRKLSRMASPATPKEVNNNMEDDVEDIETTTAEIICEIAPSVSYSGEGLGMIHSGPKFKKILQLIRFFSIFFRRTCEG